MNKIEITPSFSFFLCDNIIFFITLIGLTFFAGFVDPFAKFVCLVLAIICVITLYLRYLKMKRLKWIIEEEQIIYIRGVLTIKKDFTELYRIIDYQENQNIINLLSHTKTINILCNDRTNPILKIIGIDKSEHGDIINVIRRRSEQCKKKRNIYELANPNNYC